MGNQESSATQPWGQSIEELREGTLPMWSRFVDDNANTFARLTKEITEEKKKAAISG